MAPAMLEADAMVTGSPNGEADRRWRPSLVFPFVAVSIENPHARPATRACERRAFSALRLCVLCVSLLLAGGCAGKSTAIDRAQTHLAQGQRAGNSAQAYGESGMALLTDLAAYVVEAGKPVYQAAATAFARQAEAVAAAQASNAAAQGSLKEVQGEIDQVKTQNEEMRKSFWSPRQKRLFWWAVGILATAMVLRIVGLMLTGGGGAVAAWTGTTLLGVLTGGVSLIQALFDNLWFRWRGRKAEETPDVHPGLNGEPEGSAA